MNVFTMLIKKLFIIVSCVLFVGACSTTDTIDSQAEYSSASPRSSTTLVMPPGLTAPDNTAGYKMLDNQQLHDGYLLNQAKDMQIMQGGSERWLIIRKKTVDQSWPMMLGFLNQQGLNIKNQNKNIGMIETDWSIQDTTVPETGVRQLFDWMGLGKMYSLRSLYKYRINMWQNESDTLVFVTNYQMNEVYPECVTNLNQTIQVQPSDNQATKWMPLPPNPQLELGFLVQFMGFAGFSHEQVKQVVASASVVESANEEAYLQGTTLVINDQFDRAWWRTGIALERAGLGIADKNRSLGEYYVYPLQSTVENSEPGFFSRMWGDDKSALQMPQAQYTIKLQESGNQTSLTMSMYKDAVDKDFIKHEKNYLQDLQKQLK